MSKDRKAKPILFNTEMVRVILDGRKTVTRRVIKQEKLRCLDSPYRKEHPETPDIQIIKKLVEPPYQSGDVLYVRETWTCWRAHRYEANADIKYLAGGEDKRISFSGGNTDSIYRDDYDSFVKKWYRDNMTWHPSIHMPKEAARIWLKVTDVRVERLHDITNAEARKEGAETEGYLEMQEQASVCGLCSESLRDYFSTVIWDSTIKRKDLPLYGWDADPYVWVIEFERAEKPDEN